MQGASSYLQGVCLPCRESLHRTFPQRGAGNVAHSSRGACVNITTLVSHAHPSSTTNIPTDVRDSQFREPVRSASRCSAKHRFIFDWNSLGVEEKHNLLPLQNATVRTFLQVIPRLLPGNKRIPVSVYAVARTTGEELPTEWALVDTLSVSRNSSGWLELNFTQTIATLWPPRPGTTVEVNIDLRVDCSTIRKVPGSLVDPATLPLENPRRRERHLPLQPMLLVFMTDEAVRRRVSQDQDQAVPVAEEQLVGSRNATAGTTERRRRSTPVACHREAFRVEFKKLQMDNIITPTMYDAGKCVGACDHSALRYNVYLGTNHAKLMASAHAVVQAYNVRFIQDTKNPCCVPISFSPLGILQYSNNGRGPFVYRLYPTMIANKCGCR